MRTINFSRTDTIAYPADWPKHYNSNEPCDLLQGPCACGAWHSIDEWKTKRSKVEEVLERKLIPIYFENFTALTTKEILVRKIIEICKEHGLECCQGVADLLIAKVNLHYSESKETIWNNIKNYLVPNLKVCEDQNIIDTTLREMVEDYKAIHQKKSNLPIGFRYAQKIEQYNMQLSIIEQRMVAATTGLDEHPEWFDYPCNCNSCLSYGEPE